MRRSPWDFWAPTVLLGIGVYRLVEGDLLLSLISLSLGAVLGRGPRGEVSFLLCDDIAHEIPRRT